ncbi:MAG: hypothetical protein LBD02_07230 [Christensenellaceae bacterium]|jgi:alanyl-tRNA synthetase|nr:hypothetical protein [Christensenellaceae bacterium]
MIYLFHRDPFARVFEAEITAQGEESPGLWRLELSDSAFYPEGGGQPCDLGTLNGLPVAEVKQPSENGPLLHFVKAGGPLQSPVRGEIDWARRRDHMQQHTGQHLLSHAFFALFGAYSLGLHIGAEESYVDLRPDGGPLPENALFLAETLASELISADLPVRQWFPSPEEIKTLPLRKAPDAHMNLRVVQIGPEAVACCGTHLPSTGQARLILALRSQASHGNLRVFFLAGERAIERARLGARAAAAAAAGLSCPLSGLAAAVQRLREEQRQLARALNRERTQGALLALGQKETFPLAGERVLLAELEGLEPRALQEAAATLPGGASIACLFSRLEGGGVSAALARAESGGQSMAALFSALAAVLGGKGGGRADFAQGRLERFDEAEATRLIRDFLNTKD